MTFRIKHCVKCTHSWWSPADPSVGIFSPALEECDADSCQFGNVWQDYEDDKIDWEGEAEEWD